MEEDMAVEMQQRKGTLRDAVTQEVSIGDREERGEANIEGID